MTENIVKNNIEHSQTCHCADCHEDLKKKHSQMCQCAVCYVDLREEQRKTRSILMNRFNRALNLFNEMQEELQEHNRSSPRMQEILMIMTMIEKEESKK